MSEVTLVDIPEPLLPPVPLLTRSTPTIGTRPPVWPADEATPLLSKCDQRSGAGAACCKESNDHDERTLLNPDIVRDIVIGLSDGLTVPFALAAGLSSLGESRLVFLGGFAELIAGTISMGIGGFLAAQVERDHYRYLRHQTAARVVRSCEGKMEREVRDVLGPVGVDDKTCSAVAKCLRDVETYPAVDVNGEVDWQKQRSGSTDEEEARMRWSKDVGITAFLVRFGQRLEDIPTRRLYISAFTIGMGYLVGGFIPLLPYYFIPRAQVALLYSCILTGVVLLIFGAVKARITGAGVGPKGYIWGAVSTLLVGGLAAGAAFGFVKVLEG